MQGQWRTEPVTGLNFTSVVDIGEVQEDSVAQLTQQGKLCVVTGCTEDPRSDHSDQIRYDIVPVAQLLAYIAQCQNNLGSAVFNMSAYPARDMQHAMSKIKQLDTATTGDQHTYHAHQSRRLWNPPGRAA